MNEIWTVIQSEFADLPSVSDVTRIVVRLTVAAILAAVLGFERERSGKAAGMRTHMLIALGSALFVIIPQQFKIPDADLSRVVQGVIAGIGFLGAGAILKRESKEEVHGLTTAAGIWLTAAIGIAAGMGQEASAVLSAILALFILSVGPRVSTWLGLPESDKAAAAAGAAKDAPASEPGA